MARRRSRGSRNNLSQLTCEALSGLFGVNFQDGELTLNNGRHEIEIDLGELFLSRVWVSFNDLVEDSVPSCYGNLDAVSVVEKENSFILIADIQSESRTIRWFATLLEQEED